MTPSDEINRALCEKFFGCWHYLAHPEVIENGRQMMRPVCSCGESRIFTSTIEQHIKESNPSYTTNKYDFMDLLQVVKKQERFEDFLEFLCANGKFDQYYIVPLLLDPKTGSMAIWEFFCKEGE